ncbi:PREDICTED: probable LRR receptor-like serine/threonine-protein kinase At3g47570 [Ipomoea nil]|uniref:probable LRR receptor-like serine/threonine-protein kinase At3g47570 n=1 Tax=Ipomoea nil TaxID=35883 RepID=UPI0009008D9A|nr:PREDICTED: probable LRR receptor-like serine/threonine-protein kinase At3g47570 [Ipomoea nil]
MATLYSYLFLFAIFIIHFASICFVQCTGNISTDVSVLLSLKAQLTLHDPNNILATNWSTATSICHWIGVHCDSQHHRVVALDISNMGLLAQFPTSLGNLSFLSSLNMSNNNFIGEIPQQLGNLHNLKVIDTYCNHLTGSIPNSIFNISTLEYIDFSNNSLSGILPPNICHQLPNLKILYLYMNGFNGPLPANLSACSKLGVLSLAYNMFDGLIPKELGKLEMLEKLIIGGNNLTGTIPNELGNLHNLKNFGIERNQIVGSVPTFISNMSSLQILYLAANKLMGSIPREIGNLSSLQLLVLSENYFIGMIPREVSYLSKLEFINFQVNNLSGTIPEGLFNITTLRKIGLGYNHLLGSIPSTMCSAQTNLQKLFLVENVLSGVIPHSIENCSQLSVISLNDNHFSGSIPNSLENLSLLQTLVMSRNKLASDSELSFITSLTKCRKLKTLDVGSNSLHGTLPTSIGNLSSTLQNFYAHNSGFYGTIPDEVGNLTGLDTIEMSANDLSGTVPTTLHKLARLNLAENKLSGPLTGNLCKVQNLGAIYLSENRISGPIPECLGNVTSLRYIDLGSNRMNGIIPSNLWNLKNLLTLNLSLNSFSGALPSEIENLKVLYLLDLSNNNLSGIIPSTIGSLQNLINLSLAQNQIHGQIPESINGMLSLESLDLSHNNLSGSIPVSLQAIRYLHHLNVSFNSLSGVIPSNGPFKNFTSLSFLSNEALCGDARFGVPPCHKSVVQRSKAKRILRYILVALGITSVILALVVGVVLITCWRKKKHTKNEELLRVKEVERVSYYTLLHATDGYNERNVIGVGSFGTVYRGILEDGTILAIKVFDVQLEGAFQSFIVECKIMFDIRHRNLVKLLGYCSNPNFKALVLEYMPKGNLDDWLYTQDRFLDISQRLNVMIDVAYALEYLHYGYPKPVVHCDLKPSNILLDEDMVAHVGDFGIAKLLGSDDSIAYTKTLATLGYIAPEYGSEGIVSTKCDVYSYGILLMETFTRTKPTNEIFSENLSLKIWVKDSIPNRVIDIIDVNLLAQDEEPSSGKVKCLSSIMELALRCCSESPAERICMKEVVAGLQKLKRQLACCI